jgi:HK97 gp10 family phage protein
MADGIEFNVDGLPELVGRLKGIQSDLQLKGGRFALRKAANLVRDKAKANAKRLNDPATAENIADNIAVRWSGKTFKRTGNLMFRVGVRGGARESGDLDTGGDSTNPGGDTFYWRFLEFGAEGVPAQPFMRPALSESAGEVAGEFVKQYGKALDRAIKRSAKSGSR